MCLNTYKIYKNGNYKEETFSHKKGDEYSIEAFVNCSHCIQCDNLKANNWLIRNYYESLEHSEIMFLTLTYAHNPVVIVKKDFQDFIKRLRINIERKIDPNKKIKYFGALEYGTLKGRPHGHLIIYGFIPNDLEFLEVNKKGNILYDSEFIKKIWGNGRIAIETFNTNQIIYSSLYNTKSQIQKKEYYIQREKLKELEKQYKKEVRQDHVTRQSYNRYITLINNISETIAQIDNEKAWNKKTNECLIYSKGLGYNAFYKQYNENYIFKEYIEDKEFLTPSSWVKKTANKMKSLNAVNELKERAKFQCNMTSESKRLVNILNEQMRNTKNFMEDKKQLLIL